MSSSRDIRQQLVKEKSMTMEYFLESRHLDQVTKQMLQDYDTNNDGNYSKNEVVSIILDLKQEHLMNDTLLEWNAWYKQILCVVGIFGIILLTGMFALAFAATALVAKLNVENDGTLISTTTHQPVAVNARYDHVYIASNDNGGNGGVPCMSMDDARSMYTKASLGRNLLLEQRRNIDGVLLLSYVQINGGNGMISYTDKVCFSNRSSRSMFCIVEDPEQCPEEGIHGAVVSVSDYTCTKVQQGQQEEEYNDYSSATTRDNNTSAAASNVFIVNDCTQCDPMNPLESCSVGERCEPAVGRLTCTA